MRTLRFLLQKEFRQIFRDPCYPAHHLYDAVHTVADLTMGGRL